jgi:alpha-galactosidase
MKIAYIGAGSVVFARNLIADILAHEAMANCELHLVDIDAGRLETARATAESIARTLGAHPVIRATTDRLPALEGAQVVINSINVGGYEATEIDLTVPARFGLRQTVGDTLGVGGIFRAMRNIPEVLRIARDMEKHCPDALLINYSNPMAMHCLALHRATRIRHVGLCHGVSHTSQTMRMIVAMLDTPPEVIARHFARPYNSPERAAEWEAWVAKGLDPDLSFTCAGINHMAFFLRFESAGRDLYPQLRKALDIPHLWSLDPVRLELFRRLGYYMTETSGHTAEYVPYFLQYDEEIKARNLMINVYLNTCHDQEKAYAALRMDILAGRPVIKAPYRMSVEYASRIINALATGKPFVFNGNVHNRGGALISNLPGDACVEVPCVVDRQGIQPVSVGELPPQCAALIRPNISVQDLAVRGILEGDRTRIRQAVMMDPNTASQISLSTMDKMLDAMFEAHASRLPDGM